MNNSDIINNRYNNLTPLEEKFYEEKAIELCAEEIGVTRLDKNQLKIFQSLKEIYIKAVMKEELLNTKFTQKQLFTEITIEHTRDKKYIVVLQNQNQICYGMKFF